MLSSMQRPYFPVRASADGSGAGTRGLPGSCSDDPPPFPITFFPGGSSRSKPKAKAKAKASKPKEKARKVGCPASLLILIGRVARRWVDGRMSGRQEGRRQRGWMDGQAA